MQSNVSSSSDSNVHVSASQVTVDSTKSTKDRIKEIESRVAGWNKSGMRDPALQKEIDELKKYQAMHRRSVRDRRNLKEMEIRLLANSALKYVSQEIDFQPVVAGSASLSENSLKTHDASTLPHSAWQPKIAPYHPKNASPYSASPRNSAGKPSDFPSAPPAFGLEGTLPAGKLSQTLFAGKDDSQFKPPHRVEPIQIHPHSQPEQSAVASVSPRDQYMDGGELVRDNTPSPRTVRRKLDLQLNDGVSYERRCEHKIQELELQSQQLKSESIILTQEVYDSKSEAK